MNNYKLDGYFPLQGTCFECGRDLRHKVFDKINQRFAAGESIAALAEDYQVPPDAIRMVVGKNSFSPLGLNLPPTLRARSAAA